MGKKLSTKLIKEFQPYMLKFPLFISLLWKNYPEDRKSFYARTFGAFLGLRVQKARVRMSRLYGPNVKDV